MRTITAITIFLGLVGTAFSFCSMKLEAAGSHHCTTSNGTVVPVNHTITDTANCVKCHCGLASPGSLSLSCCGYGIHAGVMMPPPGCKIVAGSDGCSVRIVQAQDITKDCLPIVG